MKLIWAVILISCLIGCHKIETESFSENDKSKIKITNWQVYSDFTNSTILSGELSYLDSNKWKSIRTLDFEINEEYKYFLCRAVLPESNNYNSTIYTGQNNYGISIYVNKKKIYSLEEKDDNNNFLYRGFNQNLINLPYFNPGDTLLVKVNSIQDFLYVTKNLYLVSTNEFVKEVFVENLDNLFFIPLLLALGITFFIFSIFSKEKRLFFGMGLCVFTIPIFMIGVSRFFQLYLPNPLLYYHFDHLGYIIPTIGGFIALEEIMKTNIKTIKILRYINTAFLVFTIIGDLLIRGFFLQIQDYYSALFLTFMIITFFILVKDIKEGGFETKIFITGMGIIVIFASIEMAIFYNLSSNNYYYQVYFLHYGMLAFVISFIIILIYRSEQLHKIKEITIRNENEAIKREKSIQEHFTKSLIESQEKEKKRIAIELHDSIGQNLLIIKNKLLSGLRKAEDKVIETSNIKDASDIASQTIKEIREISQNLRPQHLDHLGLTAAIESMIEKVAETSEINFQFSLDDIDNCFTSENEINLYRLMQEAMNNIIKHSEASKVNIFIKRVGTVIDLNIEDNGKGFNTDKLNSGKQKGRGFGMVSMFERARILGDELKLISKENGGTKLLLNIEIGETK